MPLSVNEYCHLNNNQRSHREIHSIAIHKCKIQSNFLNKHLTNLLQCNDSAPKRNRRKVGDQSKAPKWTHLNEKFYLVDGWLGLQRNNSVNFAYISFLPAYVSPGVLCVCGNLIKTNFHLQRVAHQAISQAQAQSKSKKKENRKGMSKNDN